MDPSYLAQASAVAENWPTASRDGFEYGALCALIAMAQAWQGIEAGRG